MANRPTLLAPLTTAASASLASTVRSRTNACVCTTRSKIGSALNAACVYPALRSGVAAGAESTTSLRSLASAAARRTRSLPPLPAATAAPLCPFCALRPPPYALGPSPCACAAAPACLASRACVSSPSPPSPPLAAFLGARTSGSGV